MEEISRNAKRCRSCRQIGSLNSSKKGKEHHGYRNITDKKYYCIDCENNEISLWNYYVGNGRCRSCSKTGKLHPNYKDGKKQYHYGLSITEWNKIRFLIYKRDNFTCQRCSKKNLILDVHHKIPYRISKNNFLENLITLCRKCHMKVERGIKI